MINILKYLQPSCIMLVLSIAFFTACQPNTAHDVPSAATTESTPTELAYDASKAEQYGADEYGMRKYVMAFLKRGPNRDLDSVKAAELQMAHMENIGRMAEEGTLVLAGPFFGDQDLRGIYLFAVESIAEAEALTKTDPAIQAGSLVMELMEWYGSAGVMAINDLHDTLAKKGVTD